MADKRKFQAIKGVRDILPPESALWNRVEQASREVFGTFGYAEIRLPIIEQTELFARSVGQETDIVSKEMYSFEDHARGQLVALRETILVMRVDRESPATLDLFLKKTDEYRENLLVSTRSDETAETAGDVYIGSLIQLFVKTYQELIEAIALSIDNPLRLELITALVTGLKGLVHMIPLGAVIALRPEATASVVRAYIEHGMKTWPQPVKLYYVGPMFRRERPQKGRYRQFYQIGAEVLGQFASVAIDAEAIEMVATFFDRLGLVGTTLYINSIGCKNCRPKYVEILRQELRNVKDQLKPDSQRRIESNPLRVLDSKDESEQAIIGKLPRISDYLCVDCREDFAELRKELKRRAIPYETNWRLVRGLDYYVRTTFEITARGLGSQNAVCGGGRYDGLVELLGGPPTNGFGFAIGTDRLILALGDIAATDTELLPSLSVVLQRPDVVVAGTNEESWDRAILLAGSLRKRGLSVFLPKSGTKISRVFEAAQKIGVRVAILLGETELNEGKYTVRVINPLALDAPRDLSVQESKIVLYGKIVKLRQDLERAVVRLAAGKDNLDTQRNLSGIVDRLTRLRLITPTMNNAIKELVPTLNRAIHGETLTDGSVEWALAYGNLLINELETLSPSER